MWVLLDAAIGEEEQLDRLGTTANQLACSGYERDLCPEVPRSMARTCGPLEETDQRPLPGNRAHVQM